MSALFHLRSHLFSIVEAALDAADAGRLVRQTLSDPGVAIRLRAATAVDVIAVGKAAPAMRDAVVDASTASLRMVMATGPETGHPLPNEASVAAATLALNLARAAGETELLVVLLSGGASAKLALPAEGITLEAKQETVSLLLGRGADIHELNTVRKHLSAVKGGQLAAATRATVMTLAVSDVIGDDVSIIASGPTVPDPSTFADALRVLDARGGRRMYPPAVVDRFERGAGGVLLETPKPGDPRLARTFTRVIGNRHLAMEGARAAAEVLGYHVHLVEAPIRGEARAAAGPLIDVAAAAMRQVKGAPLCVIASGETTVHVTGTGRGGRNQELTLAMLPHVSELGDRVVAASVGTDGVDGPTDAAGALVDATTAARATSADLDAQRYLDDNNSYAFFDALGDLIRTGPTRTNVGDLQIILTT